MNTNTSVRAGAPERPIQSPVSQPARKENSRDRKISEPVRGQMPQLNPGHRAPLHTSHKVRTVPDRREFHTTVGSRNSEPSTSTTAKLAAVGLAGAAIGVAALATSENTADKNPKVNIREIIDNNAPVEKKWFQIADVRISDHKRYRAGTNAAKAITFIVAAIFITLGAVFANIPFLAVGITIATLVIFKSLYDAIRNKAGKAIAEDEKWIANTKQGLEDPNTHQKYLAALRDAPLFTPKNYRTVELPTPKE